MKSEKIKLFGYDLLLTERTAADSYLYDEFIKSKDKTYAEITYSNPLFLEQGLKYNIAQCCVRFIILGKELVIPFRLFRYIKFEKILSAPYLMDKLGRLEMHALIKKLWFIETGEDLDKKKVETIPELEKESAEIQRIT